MFLQRLVVLADDGSGFDGAGVLNDGDAGAPDDRASTVKFCKLFGDATDEVPVTVTVDGLSWLLRVGHVRSFHSVGDGGRTNCRRKCRCLRLA